MGAVMIRCNRSEKNNASKQAMSEATGADPSELTDKDPAVQAKMDQLIAAALSRTNFGPGNVVGIKRSGSKLQVYVF